jgi:DNA (cytosine-5)-methyltransferase 1
LNKQGIANALVVGGMGLERNLIKEEPSCSKGKNKDGIRKLTPRECARLQGFPDSFESPVSVRQAYKQFANSVPVPVIETIAKEILKILDTN